MSLLSWFWLKTLLKGRIQYEIIQLFILNIKLFKHFTNSCEIFQQMLDYYLNYKDFPGFH